MLNGNNSLTIVLYNKKKKKKKKKKTFKIKHITNGMIMMMTTYIVEKKNFKIVVYDWINWGEMKRTKRC